MIHELKILPPHFVGVKPGKKKCEVRINDRGYKIGDYLKLKEYIGSNVFAGNEITVRVTHILDDEQYPQPNYTIMSIEVIK